MSEMRFRFGELKWMISEMLTVLESAFASLPPYFYLEQMNKGGHYLFKIFFGGVNGYLVNGKLDKGFLLTDVI